MNAEIQFVGQTCKICRRKLVFYDDGKYCAQCNTFVHAACQPQNECEVCHQPFHLGADVRSSSINPGTVPNGLRPGSNGGPMLIIFLLLFALLVGVIIFSIGYGLSH